MVKRFIGAALALFVVGGTLAVSSPAQGISLLAAPQAATVGLRTPPALLPWGAKAVAPSAAAASNTERPATSAQYTRPKGKPGSAVSATNKASLTGPYYYYNIAEQTTSSGIDGVYANGTIGNPVLASGDYHTLGEIAVMKDGGSPRQIVEIGWNKDSGLYGDSNVHLFGYWWKNDVGQGYNNVSGWTDYPSASGGVVNLGDTLTTGVTKKFGVEYANGAWWLAYDTNWVGYYLDTNWSNSTPSGPSVTFNKIGYFQTFGEVAAAQGPTGSTTCTDMGTGVLGTNNTATPAPSRWSSVNTRLAGVNTLASMTSRNQPTTIGSYWAANSTSGATMYFGGPGAC